MALEEDSGLDKLDEAKHEVDEIHRLLSISRQATPEILAAPRPYTNITKLDLPDCGLSALPDGFENAFPNLSILFLAKNKFQQVPDTIGKCPHLQMVAFKDNGLQSIHPDALQPQLRWLILTNNQLQTLPDSIGERCHKLQKCMLSGNQLKELPESMKQCHNLELIRLASNQISQVPMVLLRHCPKLSWIALSDNPCLDSAQSSTGKPLTVVHDLEISEEHEILGRGAGGVTRKVHWNDRYVAVKEYGGSMTSDGLPQTERRLACAAAALNSPALVQVLGETKEHGSLVMEYLDGFVPLAGPPSMESCSRDVYDMTTSSIAMSGEQAETLISKLLEALAALHASGICHGDFYGHNILVESTNPANVRLTDLGAAFFYDKASPSAPYIELTEIRAFCILCQEVHQHFVVNGTSADNKESKLLTDLIQYMQQETKIGESEQKEEESLLSFEKVLVWWKQKQLVAMAQKFDPDDDGR